MDSSEQALRFHEEGLNAFREQRFDVAVESFQKALRLSPSSPVLLWNLGNALALNGNWDLAKNQWLRAVDLNPEFGDAHLNLGTYYAEHRDHEHALKHLGRALTLMPQRAEIQASLGHLCTRIGKISEAIVYFQRAYHLDPQKREFLLNYGIACDKEGQSSLAVHAYHEVIRSSKELEVQARVFWGLMCLQRRHFRAGWALAESRHAMQNLYPKELVPSQPLEKDLRGQRLFILDEQGLGDTLQFIRFAPLLKHRGAEVRFISNAAMSSLLTRTPGLDAVDQEADVRPTDRIIPTMSLPYFLQLHSEEDYRMDRPYIFPRLDWVQEMARQLEEFKGPRKLNVGIVWKGNPNHRWDHLRSISFENVDRAWIQNPKLKDIAWVSVQLDEGSSQMFKGTSKDGRLSPSESFEQTAGLIQNLDVLITVDTSMAHLAGAMGKRVWLLLPPQPDWRWGLKGSSSIWYPSMRLYRAQHFLKWDDVFQKVTEDLAGEIKGAVSAV